jgi:hypothetical protein
MTQMCIMGNEQQFDNRSVLDGQLTDAQKGDVRSEEERCRKRGRSVEVCSVKRPDLTFY